MVSRARVHPHDLPPASRAAAAAALLNCSRLSTDIWGQASAHPERLHTTLEIARLRSTLQGRIPVGSGQRQAQQGEQWQRMCHGKHRPTPQHATTNCQSRPNNSQGQSREGESHYEAHIPRTHSQGAKAGADRQVLHQPGERSRVEGRQ